MTANGIYQTPLYDLLKDLKVTNKGDPFTHTLIGRTGGGIPSGSFNVPDEKKPELIKLLHHTLFELNIPVHLTEKPTPMTMIKVDFDFRYLLEENCRKYTLENIKELVELYNKAIEHYLPVDLAQLNAYIFERDKPYIANGNVKDGVHLMYPEIITDVKIQHLIREFVLVHGRIYWAS